MHVQRGRARRFVAPGNGGVDWIGTLTDTENRGPNGAVVTRLHRLSQVDGNSQVTLVLLDTSGSQASRGALADAKGAVAELCYQAYLQRQPLELIGFSSGNVVTLQAARKPPRDIVPMLDKIGAGGGTPLRKALLHAGTRLKQIARQNPSAERRLILFTDARSRDDFGGIDIDADISVIDTEQTAVRIGKAMQLARTLHASYRHIQSLPLR